MNSLLFRRESQITYGFGKTRFGEVMIAKSDEGIVRLDFIRDDRQERIQNLHRYSASLPVHDDTAIKHECAQINTIWDGGKNASLLRFDLRGTDFQMKVWNALLKIPFGKTVSYRNIANDIGKPKAVRAVGSAVGKNPVSLLIPCHRVIRADKKIGEYAWGRDLKIAILEAEGA